MVWGHEFRIISSEYIIAGGFFSGAGHFVHGNAFTVEFSPEYVTEPVRHEECCARCPASDMSETT